MEKEGLKNTMEELKLRNSVIQRTIDTLLDIRLTLTVRRLIDKTINSIKFKEIVDKAKLNADEKVKKEIDNTFDYYFNKNNNPKLFEVENDSDGIIKFDETKESFKDGESKGRALTLNNGRFTNNDSDTSKAA